MQPLVSVVIPAYNSSAYIKEALESVFKQTYANIETIVVDDGSTDNTKDVVGPYMGRIKYIYKANGGPASARNLGIKHSKGEYIAFLDADDMWLGGKLEYQIKEIRNGIGLVGAGAQGIGCYHGRARDISLYTLLNKNTFSNSGVLVKRECFDKVGLFDDRHEFRAVEDWDMWLRIARQYKVIYLDLPLVRIRQNPYGISSAGNADKMLRNELCVLKKLFSDKSIKTSWPLKRKAYSCRYYSAAVAYREARKIPEARKHALKAIMLYPLNFMDMRRLGLAVKAILGVYGRGVLDSAQ